jgi:HD-like signal output (HDOD) protein
MNKIYGEKKHESIIKTRVNETMLNSYQDAKNRNFTRKWVDAYQQKVHAANRVILQVLTFYKRSSHYT